MQDRRVPIGRAAELTRVKVPTIRYHEEIGLLPASSRTASNRRTYGNADLRRLKFVRHARALGFDLDALRQLLALAGLPDEPCEEADEIAAPGSPRWRTRSRASARFARSCRK